MCGQSPTTTSRHLPRNRRTNVGVTENIHEAQSRPCSKHELPALLRVRSSRHGVIGIVPSNGWVPQQAPQSSRGRLLCMRRHKEGKRRIKRTDHVPRSCDLLDGVSWRIIRKKRMRSRDNEIKLANEWGRWLGMSQYLFLELLLREDGID